MNQILELIKKEELKYNQAIENISQEIIFKQSKLVFVAGASCSGKTTSTKKLSEHLQAKGIETSVVSLDDFYLTFPLDMPFEKMPDVESPESLDLPYLQECMARLSNGLSANIPIFDFKQKKRLDVFNEIQLDDNEVCLIEGLHALNPAIYGVNIDLSTVLRVYLFASCEIVDDPRFIRRLVRDFHHRNAPADLTFRMWKGVRNGEKKYIHPFEDTADFSVNTYFAYELSVFRDEAISILSTLDANNQFYEKAQMWIRFLTSFKSVGKEYVPIDSLLHEFLY